MKKITRFGYLALFCLLAVLVPAVPCQEGKTGGEIHVLFIGNSLTYYNDLPKMVAALARADKQRPLHYERETPGGCTFAKHWTDGKALAKIQSRKWDFVVLQDNSQGPLNQRESMFDHARKFDAEIKKQGARTILYMTWALLNRPEDQPAISKAYLELAADLKCQVAPVGTAWQAALKANRKLALHTNDKKHPTATGTYLAACVIYATIYSRNPEGLPGNIGKLTDEEARALQTVAWKAFQKKKE
jgi:hypothetical protein